MAPHLLSPSTPLVIGHRGAGRSATENTSASFHEARRLGADWVELDVVATADGKLALAHDIFVDGEPVWLQQAADLPFEMLGPESVPEGMGIALEVKLVPTDVEGRGTLRALLPALEKLAAGHPLLCLAFDPVAAARLSQMGIPTGWIVKQGLPTVEAAITAMALHDGFVPATINYSVPDEQCDLDVVPNAGRRADIAFAMSNSLGFGGHNVSLVLKKMEA